LKIFFRIYAGGKYGFGHAIRSIAIAKELVKRHPNLDLIFLLNNDSSFSDLINEGDLKKCPILYQNDKSEEEFIVTALSNSQPDLLFIDTLYQYSLKEIIAFKERSKVVLFHNLTNGLLAADLTILPIAHIHPSFYENPLFDLYGINLKYGAEFISLNPKVLEFEKRIVYHNKIKPIIGLTTGASDPEGVMLKLMDLVSLSKSNEFKFQFYIGREFLYRDMLKEKEEILTQSNIDFQIVDFDIKNLIDCDLVISAFGVTNYELMYIGIPVITIAHSLQTAQSAGILFNRYKKTINIGYWKDVSLNQFLNTISEFKINSEVYFNNAAFWTKQIDNKGIERVVDEIMIIIQK